MKKLITLVAFAITTLTQAQTNIEVPNSLEVNENNYMLQDKLRNGFEIMVQGEAKDILKEFEDFLENKFDFKLKSSNGLITGEELTSIIISEKRFSLYALVKEDGEGNHLRLWMAPGLDVYFSSKSDALEATAAKSILRTFVKQYYSTFLNKSLAATTKVVEDAGDNLEDLVKEEQGTRKERSKAEKNITKADAKIVKNQEKIQKLQEGMKSLEKEKTELSEEIETLNNKQAELKKQIEQTREVFNQKEALRQKQKVNLERLQNL